jgi:hypothetical protein
MNDDAPVDTNARFWRGRGREYGSRMSSPAATGLIDRSHWRISLGHWFHAWVRVLGAWRAFVALLPQISTWALGYPIWGRGQGSGPLCPNLRPLLDRGQLCLDEVVSRTEASELAQTALGGTVADLSEVVDRQSALILAALEVFAVPVARFHGCPCARPEDTPELLVIGLPDPAGAAARWDAAVQVRHQLMQPGPHVLFL